MVSETISSTCSFCAPGWLRLFVHFLNPTVKEILPCCMSPELGILTTDGMHGSKPKPMPVWYMRFSVRYYLVLVLNGRINGLRMDPVLDSFCVVFHDMPPSYSVDDFEHRLPSPDELWSSQDAHSWESHLQSCQGKLEPDTQIFYC